MSKAPKLQEIISLPPEVKQAGQNGNLVFFIGAGISRSLGLPSWKELAEESLRDLRKKELFNYAEIEQLKPLKPKLILSIAQLMDRGRNFKQEIAQHLQKSKSEAGGIYETINRIGCVCVTTNYDELLVPRLPDSSEMEDSQKPEKPSRIYLREDIFPYLLDKLGTIIHLHGCKAEPDTMIVTTKDYLKHYNHPNIRAFLEHLFKKKTLVFLGYGLEEEEVLEHLLRRGEAQENDNPKHFAIQGFFRSQQTLYENLHRYYKETFGIELLGFVKDYKNYEAIEDIITDWANQIKIQHPPLHEDIEIIIGTL